MKRNTFSNSEKCFSQAKKFIPGGVNSPVRAFKAVGMDPLFIEKAQGAYIWDADSNKYIDYVLSWGPMILGHANSKVLNPVINTLKKGTSFGAPTQRETELAKLVTEIYPSIGKLRLTSSGTEAAMSAIRLARGYSGKEKIIKFEGCYHGHFDSLLVKAGSGAATFGVPSSKGVHPVRDRTPKVSDGCPVRSEASKRDGCLRQPVSNGVNKSFARDTIVIPFNNITKVEEIIEKEKDNIACVIVEPIPANMGVIFPQDNFLQKLRKLTKDNNILLIFDEVITGFRVALGGAQELFKIKPDLTILGKIIGGGFPIGAFGGSAQIMDQLSPDGGVYQAGTLSGNPVAVEAGINTIKVLMQDKGIYRELEKKGRDLELGFKKIIEEKSLNIIMNRIGSLFTLFFTPIEKSFLEITNYDDAVNCDLNKFAQFFRGMLNCGIYLAPSQFEANFISVKHKDSDIKKTLSCAEYVLSN